MDGACLFSAIRSLVQGPHRNATSKSRALYQPLADKFKGSKDTWQLQDEAEDAFWADVSGKKTPMQRVSTVHVFLIDCNLLRSSLISLIYYDLL